MAKARLVNGIVETFEIKTTKPTQLPTYQTAIDQLKQRWVDLEKWLNAQPSMLEASANSLLDDGQRAELVLSRSAGDWKLYGCVSTSSTSNGEYKRVHQMSTEAMRLCVNAIPMLLEILRAALDDKRNEVASSVKQFDDVLSKLNINLISSDREGD